MTSVLLIVWKNHWSKETVEGPIPIMVAVLIVRWRLYWISHEFETSKRHIYTVVNVYEFSRRYTVDEQADAQTR